MICWYGKVLQCMISVHTQGQMLKESTARGEEVSGLSHFCLSFVWSRWEDGDASEGVSGK